MWTGRDAGKTAVKSPLRFQQQRLDLVRGSKYHDFSSSPTRTSKKSSSSSSGDLIWKAVMTAAGDESTTSRTASPPAARHQFITFVCTPGRRNSPAPRPAIGPPKTIRHVSIAASFQYPSLEGHLRAYDMRR
jgi:hypothetical protein